MKTCFEGRAVLGVSLWKLWRCHQSARGAGGQTETETERDESEGGRVAQEHGDALNITKARRLPGDKLQREAEGIHSCLLLLLFHSVSSLLSKLNTSGTGTGDLTPGDREASMLDSRQLPPGCYNVAKKHLQTDTSESSYTQMLPPPLLSGYCLGKHTWKPFRSVLTEDQPWISSPGMWSPHSHLDKEGWAK